MTAAAKLRRAQRRDVEKLVLLHLQTRSILRLCCRQSQFRAMAKQIARNVVAKHLREQIAAGLEENRGAHGTGLAA